MLPAGSRPALRSGAPALATLAIVLAMSVTAAVAANGVEVDLDLSEDVLVMNSEVDLTVTLRDGATGDPVEGCHVVVHIIRRSGDGGQGDHVHEAVDWPPEPPAPRVDVQVTADPEAGWNLRVLATNWRWAPWNASLENVWGEGHAHLYIDGEKVGRLYGGWHHVTGLERGEHTVRVTLNTNDHKDINVDGALVEDSAVLIQEEEGGGHSHGGMRRFNVTGGEPVPRVDLSVAPDPKKGWNLRVTTQRFSWAPENASTQAVMGEGHGHLYVDGHKVGRLYGEWYHLGSLSEGSHEVRVTLNANDHSDYAYQGEVIGDEETVVVPAGAGNGGTPGHGHGAMGINATPTGEPGRYRLTHRFDGAGDYLIEVHVTGEGYDGAAATFEVEVLEGDPAAVTVAWIVSIVVLTVVAISVVQYASSRRKARELKRLEEE